MGAISEFVKTLGAARLGAMGAVAVGLAGIFIFLAVRFSQPQMTTLFNELPLGDSGIVVSKLEAMNIPYELKNNGASILVPRENVLRLRMKLAEEGLPAGGAVGYEIFDKGDTLGATSFVQNLNHLRALEGELSRTIRALDRVQLARVHLVLPSRQLFSRETSEPSASIVLKLRGSLDKSQIGAIQHLVASAVKDLKPGRVSIVDESGALLASGEGGKDGMVAAGQLEERNIAYERRLKGEIEEIVTSIVGHGKARVQLTAEMDYNRITQTSETFDPDGQVVRSTQSRQENAASQEGGKKDAVSVANQLPGAENLPKDGSGTAENSTKTEEIVNYEISRTTKTEVVEAGGVKRVSVAVLVDGIYRKDDGGEVQYQPRSTEQLEQIAALVRSAIGFDKARGDTVEVVNLRFAPPLDPQQLTPEEDGFLNLTKGDYFHLVEMFILLILGVLAIILVVRPLVRRIITPDQPAPQVAAPAEQGGQLPGPDPARAGLSDEVRALIGSENKTSQMIDVAQIAGEVHGSTVRKIGDMVQSNPDEALAIVRHWLNENRTA